MRKAKPGIFFKAFFLAVVFSIAACEKISEDLPVYSDTGTWTQMTKSNSGLPGDMVWKFALKGDELWASFRGQGAGVFKNGDWTFYSVANSGLINNYINDIEVDKNGNIHLATNNGYCVRSVSGEWWSYRDPYLTTMKINTVKITPSGDIWLGTAGEGFYVDEGGGFEKIKVTGFENVNVIEQDASGNIWLGTDNGLLKYDGNGFTRMSIDNGLPSNEINVLYIDNLQRMWIASDGANVVTWMKKNSTVLNYLYLRNGVSGNFVMDIFQDIKGNMWFATWYDGLIRYDGIVCHSYEKYNGFFEDDVNCVQGDTRGNLWIGLWSKGLIKYTLPLE